MGAAGLCWFVLWAAPAAVQPPALIEGHAAEYPVASLQAGDEGAVKLRILIDARGRVERIDVVDGASPLLNFAAMGAATHFVFRPARQDGDAVRAEVHYTMRFVLPREDKAAATPDPVAPGPDQPTVDALIRGRVRRAGTMQAVLAAEVTLWVGESMHTAYTDAEGSFSFSVAARRVRLEVAAAEYITAQSEHEVGPGAQLDLLVHLQPAVADPFETVVREQKQRGDVAQVTLSRDELKAIPGTMGDALRVVESLPGVARAPFLGGALIVRGGLPGDTQVFLDGVPVPVLFHFGGLASVIGSPFLGGIDFYPGGFSSRYGRATAGVVDIRTHELGFETVEGHLDIDLLDTGFFIGGPIDLEDVVDLDLPLHLPPLEVAVAARRSYGEVPASLGILGVQAAAPATGLSLTGIPIPVPVYSDFQAKASLRPRPGHRLSLFAFGSEDQFVILGDNTDLLQIPGTEAEPFDFSSLVNTLLGNRFWRVVGEHKLQVRPWLRNTLRPWLGNTQKGLLANGLIVQAFTRFPLLPPAQTWDFGVRNETEVDVAPWLQLTVGLDQLAQTVDSSLGPPLVPEDAACTPEDAEAGSCTPFPVTAFDLDGTFWSIAAYATATIGPFAGLTLFPGVRAHHAQLQYTEKSGNIPYPGRPQTVRTLRYTNVDPRLSVRYAVSGEFAVKGALGSFRQPPNLESAALQVAGPPVVQPRSHQLIGGFEADLWDRITLDAQVYGSLRDRYTRDRTKLFGTPDDPLAGVFVAQPQDLDSRGRGGTLGFEFMLRHQPSAYFFGWIAYTYARTWLDLGTELDPFHPAPFDSTHNVIVVGKVNLPWQVTVGARFQYATGAPSPVHDTYAVLHNVATDDVAAYRPVPGTGRRPRLPDYHRLDVRIDRPFVFDSWTLNPYLEVINAYAYPNTEVSGPSGDFRGRGLRPLVPGMPLFPSFGLEADF